jgi:hypothetical protein
MSRPSETDKRYERYADIFDSPETAHSIEEGWRALHWSFVEAYNPSGVVRQHAEEAQRESLRRTQGDPARRAAELERQRDWSPARHPIRAKRQGRSR